MISLLRIIKSLPFLFCYFAILIIFGLKMLRYYTNGQAIASAHMDDHFFPVVWNVFVAFVFVVIFAVIFAVAYIFKRKIDISKWFTIPVTLLVFAVPHWRFTSMFYCCPCCCTARDTPHWINIAVLILLMFVAALIVVLRYPPQFRTMH